MAMSRKDYEAVAAVLAENYRRGNPAERYRVEAIVSGLSDVFRVGNPRFDSARFIDAATREV